MKLSMSKKHLADALGRMKEVSTKGLSSEFEMAHRITIQAENGVVQFFAANGHLNARWEVTDQTDSKLKCETPGKVTVDAIVAVGVVSAIGGMSQDSLLEVELEQDILHIRDVSSKSKKKVKLQTIAKGHSFTLKRPSGGFSFSLSKEEFKTGVSFVGAYASDLGYKIKYQMVCLHFLKNETRFVCGDGMRFVVFSEKLSTPNTQVDTQDGMKFLFPVDQAAIIGNVLEGAERIDFVFEDEQTCYIKPANAMEMKLHGIPKEKYIPYEKHAFCTDKARLIVDVKSSDFKECMNIVASVKDKERESQGIYHHAKFQLNGALDLVVDEQKYQCEVECPADIYHVQGEKSYKSMYAATYLSDVLLASKKPMIRFYCIDEKKTLVAEPIEIDDTIKKDGIPQARPGTDDPRLSIFFTAVVEDDGSDT